VYAYTRGGKYVIALNFTGETKPLALSGEIVVSTHLDRDGKVDALELRPNEGVIMERR
jgi:hypothetical protein